MNRFPTFCVNSDELSPCSTSLFHSMAWSTLLHFSRYTMGAKVSLKTGTVKAKIEIAAAEIQKAVATVG